MKEIPVEPEKLLDELNDGVFVATEDGSLLYANAAFAAIVGCKPDSVLATNIAKDIIERPLEWKALVSMLEQGSLVADYEVKCRRCDGTQICASISASRVRRPDGSLVGIAGVLRDITTRKVVENELRDKAFRTDIVNKIAKLAASDVDVRKRLLVDICTELRKLVNFDILTLGLHEEGGRHVEVVAPDPERPGEVKTLGRVLFENSIVEALRYGKPAISIDGGVGRRQFSELAVIDIEGMSSMLSVPLTSRGRVYGSLNIFYSKAKEYTSETIEVMTLVADQVAGVIDNMMLLSSLEAKIRLQDALVRSAVEIQRAVSTEQVYAAIAMNINDIVPYKDLSFYMIDWQKNLVYPVFAAGTFTDEIMASPGTIDEGVVGSVAKSGIAEFLDDVDADPRVAQIPGVPATHDAMLAIPLVGSKGVLGVLELYRPKGEVFTVRDLEAGKLFAQQAAVALENSNLLSELQEAKKEIEMLNDLMFHDINNFNFAAMNYIEMAARSADVPPEHRNHLEKALLLIRQTATLIENVKKLTRIGALSSKDFFAVDISQVLRKVVSGLEHSYPGRSISVNLNVPDECLVMANSLVDELFVNLLSNAVKYDPHEEVEIDVDCERIEEEGRQVWRICVTDRGHGVPDDKKALLFQKFVRLKTDTKTPGTGLGLSICRALVDRYGGRIWVEDRVPGKSELGARFCLTLPAAR
ncbi:MAG: GAF domain-containing protein [Thermoplasmata archaeon]